jgi:hypothetical protein
MLDLIRQGGGPMLFVLIFGLLTFVAVGMSRTARALPPA